ncbi:MAG: TonB-dependent receptor [Pirellulales bacterium]|nr:TonB-dependent receptor [Pirellulales bacterium]
MPLAAVAQQTVSAPLPRAYYTAYVDEAASAPSAPNGEASKNGDGLEFLNQSMEQIARTQVRVPSMDIQVSTVTKQDSTVGQSPAAVFVISSEMIRRSGATCVPELLRMAPGVEVARVNSHAWAISIRGFNARFSNKLLVLVDGRVVYNQLYSGVYWDVQDMILEDIERIEVIRGPGGTLWGANAVNGVINIITKKAQDTQGTLVSVGGGNLDRSINAVRVGGSDGDGFHWRMYGRHFERGTEYNPDGASDDWRMGQGGFRIDWDLDRSKSTELTVLGNFYGGKEGQKYVAPVPTPPYYEPILENESVGGSNVLARFTRKIDDESDWSLLAYFDQTYRNQYVMNQQINTMDFEFQHRFPAGRRHHVIWGLLYRQISSDLPTQTFTASFDPARRTTDLFSGFVQDDIKLVEDRLSLILGTKLETNSFTGFEYQPSARVLWTPDRRHTGWAAISRAVRTPSLFEEDATANLGPFPVEVEGVWYAGFYRLMGNRHLLSEDVISYEIGFRTQVTDRFSWDIATFFNSYDNLIWSQPSQPVLEDTYAVIPAMETNGWYGQTYGFELAAQYEVSETWRLSGSYSFLRMVLRSRPGYDVDYEGNEGNSPINQVRLYSAWDLGRRWELDSGLRYVDALPTQNVPAYITMDARLAWRPSQSLEIALVGQNLFDPHHPEFGPEAYGFENAQVRRTVFGQVMWRR